MVNVTLLPPGTVIWLAFFFLVAYLYLTEDNFEAFIVFVVNYMKSLVYKAYTAIRVNPKSPIFLFYKVKASSNADEAAKQIAKERGLDLDEEWNQ